MRLFTSPLAGKTDSAFFHAGLYRIAGAQSERQHLERAFQTGQKVDISSRGRYQDINIVTGAFKGWLSQLPDPVICSNIYHSVVGAMSEFSTFQAGSFRR